jgi:hypothetical protein
MRRVYAEDHAAVLSCALRTAFALDIPSDAAPAFALTLGDGPARANGFAGAPHAPVHAPATKGGVEWKVRVCLLVCVVPERADVRGLRREGDIGEWGSAFVPLPTPLCRRTAGPALTLAAAERASTDSVSSWTGWLSSIVAPVPTAFHDGDDASSDAGSDESEDDERRGGWEEMRTEMVECEVPVRVWPGNTAFRAMDVVFDV